MHNYNQEVYVHGLLEPTDILRTGHYFTKPPAYRPVVSAMPARTEQEDEDWQDLYVERMQNQQKQDNEQLENNNP